MSSKRRVESSRANGALSHGPKTEEGLERCRVARLTHGLTAEHLLVQGEDEDAYRELRDVCILQFRPANSFEADLVEEYIAARWRLRRLLAMETCLLDVEVMRCEKEIAREFSACSIHTRMALAFRGLSDQSRVFANFDRHEARLRRTCDRTLKTLTALKEGREKQKVHQGPSSAIEQPPERPVQPVAPLRRAPQSPNFPELKPAQPSQTDRDFPKLDRIDAGRPQNEDSGGR